MRQMSEIVHTLSGVQTAIAIINATIVLRKTVNFDIPRCIQLLIMTESGVSSLVNELEVPFVILHQFVITLFYDLTECRG